MNRAFLIVGIPGILIATAYTAVFYGWRAGAVVGCAGAALIFVAVLLIRSTASLPPR